VVVDSARSLDDVAVTDRRRSASSKVSGSLRP